MTNLKSVKIDVVSDIVCPWCYIGKRRLDRAVGLMQDVPVYVRYHPYFVEPEVPREGMPREDFVVMHFGSVEAYQARSLQIVAVAEAENISYRPDLIKTQPNTLDCHRLIHWATTTPNGDRSAATEQRLMELFLRDGADLTDIDVLVQAAADCWLDPTEVKARLKTDDDIQTVMLLARAAASQGISGVPTYVFEDKYEITGAQSVEQLVSSIRQISLEINGSRV